MIDHTAAERHHHHSHAVASIHPQGHHLLSVEHLSVSFDMYDASAPYLSGRRVRVTPIRDLSIAVHKGELVAIVGASGSGKTLLADAVFGMFEPNSEVHGRIWFDGCDLDAAGLAALRGNGLSLVPQGVDNLDSLMRVGEQIVGAMPNDRKRGMDRRAKATWKRIRLERMRKLMDSYGLDSEVERMYPYQLSGGMARRVLLLCALMDDPKVIVADEPTPGLDLDLAVHALDDLKAFARDGGGVLLITHDLELALRVADRVAVFKDGSVIEETSAAAFDDPARLEHPFSRDLWHALPVHDFSARGGETVWRS